MLCTKLDGSEASRMDQSFSLSYSSNLELIAQFRFSVGVCVCVFALAGWLAAHIAHLRQIRRKSAPSLEPQTGNEPLVPVRHKLDMHLMADCHYCAREFAWRREERERGRESAFQLLARRGEVGFKENLRR